MDKTEPKTLTETEKRMRIEEQLKNIRLYPSPADVFHDLSLEAYFRPLLTYDYNGTPIHLLSTDGLYNTYKYKFSEHSFWGFEYTGGKYKFLGNLHAFGDNNIETVYKVVKEDFELNKERYLKEKTSHKLYWEMLSSKVEKIADFDDEQDIQDYAESLYSYFMAKLYYEQTGNFCYIMEIVANFHHDNSSILLNSDMMGAILNEFFTNIDITLENNYFLSKDHAVCATEGYRFTRYGGISLAFFDKNAGKVYIMEHYS